MKAFLVIGGFVLFSAIVVAAGYLVEKLTDIEDSINK